MKTAHKLWMPGIMFVLLLPAVFAQSVLSNPWMYFTINTLIIWFILVSIIRFMTTDAEGKGKTFFQIGAFFAALLLSWNFVGGSGFIWKVGFFAPLFSLRFLVNMIALSMLFYYLIVWIAGKDKLEGKDSKFGTWVMVILLSSVIASKMPYYFWQGGTGKQIVDLLFGQYGVLTLKDNRLFLFITGIILFSWLFTVIKVGREDGSKLNTVIAVLIATHLASGPNPVGVSTMVKLGEIIATLAIATNLKTTFGEGKWFLRWGFAFVLVDWITGMMFPEHAFFGLFSSSSPLKVTFWIAIGILGLGLLVFFGFKWGWLGEAKSRLMNKLKQKARRTWGLSNLVGKWAGGYGRDATLPGELQNAFKELRLEVFTLMSYIQRHQIFKAKQEKLQNIIVEIGDKERVIVDGESPTIEAVHKEIVGSVEGNSEGMVGVASSGKLIEEVFGELDEVLRDTNISVEPEGNDEVVIAKFIDEKKSWIEKRGQGLGEAENVYERVSSKIKAINFIEGYRPLIIDMYNLHGEFMRGYGFVHDPETGAVLEVDQRGVCVDDMNAIKMLGKSGSPRKFKKKDIRVIPNAGSMRFGQIGNYILRDWEFFMKDLEILAFHPFSRSLGDYEQRIPNLKFSSVKYTKTKQPTEVGFDREALKNPGFFTYRGRSSFSDIDENKLFENPPNKFPGVSVHGLWKFIGMVAKSRVDDSQLAERYLNEYFAMKYDDRLAAMGQNRQQQANAPEESNQSANQDGSATST